MRSAIPDSVHCPDIQAGGNNGNDLVAQQDSASSSRSGPGSTPQSSIAAISLAVTRSHRRHVRASSATSEQGGAPRPWISQSRLTASSRRALDPHPHGPEQEPTPELLT